MQSIVSTAASGICKAATPQSIHILASFQGPETFFSMWLILHKGVDLKRRSKWLSIYDSNDLCTQDGFTPLHVAASQGNYEVVKMLLSSTHHPDVNARANVSVYLRKQNSLYGKINVLFITGCIDVCYRNLASE